MSKELAFVLINPHTIAKSRTGGVIARYIGRTDLRLVGARMFGPGSELVEKHSQLVRGSDAGDQSARELIADYVLAEYAPDKATGKRRRVMLLLFEGEDAIAKIWKVTGAATLSMGSGETIRDTYGDYILDENNNVRYFEPAVLVAQTKKMAAATLQLWSRYSESDGGIIHSAIDVKGGPKNERTLVLLKPDNFRRQSARPGNIIDLLSISGLRIVGAKKFCMTVDQAERFYGPVKAALQKKFGSIGSKRAADALSQEFGFPVPEDAVEALCERLAPIFAETQFESIVKFMTGFFPSECADSEKKRAGKEDCLALAYEGEDAVEKIRGILGETDPSKARPGSVRREFGSDIMVNAAHASDSLENARREMEIIDIEEEAVSGWVNRHYGGPIAKAKEIKKSLPRSRGGNA
ncbi:MAG: nucleoside-diphosphate kinase [Verrucomicrobiota bacterium]